MSEENKALVRRYFEEVWEKGNLDVAEELLTTNFVRYGPTGTEAKVTGWLFAGRLVAPTKVSLWATLLPAIS